MTPPLYVSFFTPAYAAEAAGLIESLERFNLLHDVRPVPSLGTWTLNCGMKPAFIRDRMQEYPGRPVVWLDADARIRKRPDLFYTLACDFAAHWRFGSELLSGTMFWGATKAAKALAEAWCESQLRTPEVWDQRTLSRVIESGVPAVRIERLPSTYTRVLDDPKMGEAVIWHGQASRRLKSST